MYTYKYCYQRGYYIIIVCPLLCHSNTVVKIYNVLFKYKGKKKLIFVHLAKIFYFIQQAAALEQHFGAANMQQQLEQRQLQMLQQHHIQQQQQQLEQMMRRPEDSNIMQVVFSIGKEIKRFIITWI